MNKCKDCKSCGEPIKDDICFCNNSESIFKVCSKNATVCEKFESKTEGDDRDDTVVIAWMPLPEPYKAESEE